MDDYDDDDNDSGGGSGDEYAQENAPTRTVHLQQQRGGAVYNEMFEAIQLIAGHSAKVTALLGKDGNVQQCDRMSTLLDRMVQIDQEVDKDRRAVDETWRQHGTDVSEKPILRQHYNKIRKTIQMERAGRNGANFENVRTNLSQIRDKLLQQREDETNKNTNRGAPADESMQEVEITSQNVSDKDPLTKKRIKEPMRNPICNHVYDRESIKAYIEFNRGRRQLYQCPVEMCQNKQVLRMEQLLPFPEFFQNVRRRSRSRSRSRSRGLNYTNNRSTAGSSRTPNGPSTSAMAD